MVDAITGSSITKEAPTPNGSISIQAAFNVDPDTLKKLGPSRFNRTIEFTRPALRTIFSREMQRLYVASGLKVRSGALFRDVSDSFIVEVRRSGRKVIVTATWTPTSSAAYFFAQLFGAEIVPVFADALRFKIGNKVIFAQRVVLPARKFIRFTRAASAEIAQILELALSAAVGQSPDEPTTVVRTPQRRPGAESQAITEGTTSERTATQIIRTNLRGRGDAGAARAGLRDSPFRLRKTFRRAGVPAPQARALVAALRDVGISTELSKAIIGAPRRKLVTLAGALRAFLKA